jgi:hypothetical protein
MKGRAMAGTLRAAPLRPQGDRHAAVRTPLASDVSLWARARRTRRRRALQLSCRALKCSNSIEPAQLVATGTQMSNSYVPTPEAVAACERLRERTSRALWLMLWRSTREVQCCNGARSRSRSSSTRVSSAAVAFESRRSMQACPRMTTIIIAFSKTGRYDRRPSAAGSSARWVGARRGTAWVAGR